MQLMPSGCATRRLAVVSFCNDTGTSEIYTLSLHDALPICDTRVLPVSMQSGVRVDLIFGLLPFEEEINPHRSEEHTSELQSQSNLVCRLLLEKKNLPPEDATLLAVIAGRVMTLAAALTHAD